MTKPTKTWFLTHNKAPNAFRVAQNSKDFLGGGPPTPSQTRRGGIRAHPAPFGTRWCSPLDHFRINNEGPVTSFIVVRQKNKKVQLNSST